MSKKRAWDMRDQDPSSIQGKDAKDTPMLNNTTAREANATGTNTLKEYRTKHPAFGRLGVRGHGSA